MRNLKSYYVFLIASVKKKKSLLEKEEHGEYTGSEAQQRNGKYF